MNILVTGGASGLGRSITALLAKDASNTVHITYSSSQAAAEGLQKEFANVKIHRCDFNSEAGVDSFCSTIESLGLDAIVNNAFSGSIEKQHFYKLNSGVFKDGFMHNILPVIKINQSCIRNFRKKKYGKIITILSSAVINKPPVGWSEYTAAKAYLHSLAKSWAVENAPFNITSNCISPAFMRTSLTSDTDERVVEEMTAQHPLKQLLTTNEVAAAVRFFTEASQQVNGTNMVINAAGDIV